MRKLVFIFLLAGFYASQAQSNLEQQFLAVEPEVIEWRRDFHEHPELSNREFRTAEKIAEHLKSLGIEVKTGVAHTGVVGLLKGDLPGKVVALRADIDALPVTERNDLPFKSKVETEFLENPKVDVIFGLHIKSTVPVGTLRYKPEGMMAAVERFEVHVKGKQAHGSRPWMGVDPIYISAKIIDGFQSIISREANLTEEAAVITVGKITSGVRFNIIPESAEMIGTVRTLNPKMKDMIINRMREMSETIAKAYGGEAIFEVQNNTAITYNDPELVTQMLPSLKKVVGDNQVELMKATTGGEDFSFYQEKVPGFYFQLGGMTPGNTTQFAHHTPDFRIYENGLMFGDIVDIDFYIKKNNIHFFRY